MPNVRRRKACKVQDGATVRAVSVSCLLSIKGRSFLFPVCPPQEQERFLLSSRRGEIVQEEGVMMFDLSHPQMKRERMLAQLIHVLSHIQREAYLLGG